MNKKIRVLIVDDELLAREGIRILTERDPELEIIGECADGASALNAIREKSPDLVFLDIQMPEMDGFALLSKLHPKKIPYIIFVTAYDKYALRAFDVHALDYLLKPVDEDRFDRSLRRAKSILQSGENWEQEIFGMIEDLANRVPHRMDRVVVKEEGRIFFVKAAEIDWIEAKGNYAMLHSGKKSYLIREAMSSLENQMDSRVFVRIHRSTIVNVDRIRELQSLFHGDYRVILQDGTTLLMSRRFRDRLRQQF
jgi:two-component system LytT family response regulator